MRARNILLVTILLALSLVACGQEEEEFGVVKQNRVYSAPSAEAPLLEGVGVSEVPVCADEDFVGVELHESTGTGYIEVEDVGSGREQLDELPPCTDAE